MRQRRGCGKVLHLETLILDLGGDQEQHDDEYSRSQARDMRQAFVANFVMDNLRC